MSSAQASRARGFSLMEVVFAVAIIATALITLQAVVGGAIDSSRNSVNRRRARELARQVMEEILVDLRQPDGGENFEDYPGFSYESRSEEVYVGADNQEFLFLKVTVILTFPVDAVGDAGAANADGEEKTEEIRFTSAVAPQNQPGSQNPGQPL